MKFQIFSIASYLYPTQILQYGRNIREWILAFSQLNKLKYEDGWNVYKYFPVHLLDIGINTLTGGDPRETLSSRWQKDRGAWLPKQLLQILEKIDKNHGPKVVKTHIGEGSADNKELSSGAQNILSAFWMLVVIAWVSGYPAYKAFFWLFALI